MAGKLFADHKLESCYCIHGDASRIAGKWCGLCHYYMMEIILFVCCLSIISILSFWLICLYRWCLNSSDRFVDLSSNSIDAILKVSGLHNMTISVSVCFFYQHRFLIINFLLLSQLDEDRIITGSENGMIKWVFSSFRALYL
jgi:hypothetical protein